MTEVKKAMPRHTGAAHSAKPMVVKKDRSRASPQTVLLSLAAFVCIISITVGILSAVAHSDNFSFDGGYLHGKSTMIPDFESMCPRSGTDLADSFFDSVREARSSLDGSLRDVKEKMKDSSAAGRKAAAKSLERAESNARRLGELLDGYVPDLEDIAGSDSALHRAADAAGTRASEAAGRLSDTLSAAGASAGDQLGKAYAATAAAANELRDALSQRAADTGDAASARLTAARETLGKRWAELADVLQAQADQARSSAASASASAADAAHDELIRAMHWSHVLWEEMKDTGSDYAGAAGEKIKTGASTAADKLKAGATVAADKTREASMSAAAASQAKLAEAGEAARMYVAEAMPRARDAFASAWQELEEATAAAAASLHADSEPSTLEKARARMGKAYGDVMSSLGLNTTPPPPPPAFRRLKDAASNTAHRAADAAQGAGHAVNEQLSGAYSSVLQATGLAPPPPPPSRFQRLKDYFRRSH